MAYAMTLEHRQKISESLEGRTDIFRGEKPKNFKSNLGEKRSDDFKEKCRKRMISNTINVGKVWSNEEKEKRSEAQRGERHYNWQGGISRAYKTGYNSIEYKRWRKAVFERDNYTCRECSVHGSVAYLTAHHIKSFSMFPKLCFIINNGLTLCESCHSETDNYKGRANKK